MFAHIVKAPAGIGKTIGIAKKAAASKKVIEIYVPTHKLAEELRMSILTYNPKKRVIVIKGRDAIQPSGEHFCKKHKVAKALSTQGVSVFDHLCHQEQRAGLPPRQCEHYATCPYITQFQPSDVIIYTHAYLPLQRSRLETWFPEIVIIDESFFQTCIESVQLKLARLYDVNIPAAARKVCKEIADAFASELDVLQIVKDINRDEFNIAITTLQKLSAPIAPDTSARQQTAQIKKIVSFLPLGKLLNALRLDAGMRKYLQSVTFDRYTNEITVHRRKRITRFKNNTGDELIRLNIIDASANPEIISSFFEHIKFTTLNTSRNAHVTQCYSTRCSTTSLVASSNTDRKSKAAAKARINDINLIIQRMSRDGNKVLIVGPQKVVGHKKEGIKSLIQIPPHCDAVHFNGFRGIDKWKDFDSAIIIGRNEPPVKAVEAMARALFCYDYEPLYLTGDWTTEKRGYRMKGKHVGVDVNVHPDPRIQAIVEQVREEESLQALDRLRLIHNVKIKEVVLLSNIPLNIDVDEILSWDELVNGCRLSQAFDKLNGVLPLNPAWLSAKFPNLWKTPQAAKDDVQATIQKGELSNIIYISKIPLLKYVYFAAKQRRGSNALSASGDAAFVKAELERLVGAPVRLEL